MYTVPVKPLDHNTQAELGGAKVDRQYTKKEQAIKDTYLSLSLSHLTVTNLALEIKLAM